MAKEGIGNLFEENEEAVLLEGERRSRLREEMARSAMKAVQRRSRRPHGHAGNRQSGTPTLVQRGASMTAFSRK